MDLTALPDWLFDWKTGLFWGLGCFGLAFWLLGYSLHRNLVEVRKQTVRMAEGIEAVIAKMSK